MEAKICERTISLGKNRYRIHSDGSWSSLHWGWYPNGGDRPSYRWMSIPKDKVPEEVKKACIRSIYG